VQNTWHTPGFPESRKPSRFASGVPGAAFSAVVRFVAKSTLGEWPTQAPQGRIASPDESGPFTSVPVAFVGPHAATACSPSRPMANVRLPARGCKVRAWAKGAHRARNAHITDETEALLVAPTCQTDERLAEQLDGDRTHPDIRQHRRSPLHDDRAHPDIRQRSRSPSLICCDNDLCIPRFSRGLQATKGHTKRRSIQHRSAKQLKAHVPTWLKQGVVKVMTELFTY
jgi:hypothetical protein